MNCPPKRVIAALGSPCPYCGIKMNGKPREHGPHRADMPSRDHINPRSQGGGPTIMVCRRCNLDKADRTLAEWLNDLEHSGDRRFRRVNDLLMDLETGVLITTDNVSGLAEGVFA